MSLNFSELSLDGLCDKDVSAPHETRPLLHCRARLTGAGLLNRKRRSSNVDVALEQSDSGLQYTSACRGEECGQRPASEGRHRPELFHRNWSEI